MKEQTTSESSENDEIHLDDELNIDFTCDYSEDIKEDVDDVVAASTSLQGRVDEYGEGHTKVYAIS